MNEQEERIKFLEYEVEKVNTVMENTASRDNFFQLEKRFCNYAPKERLEEMREDINSKANREDIAIITAQNDEIKKNANKFATIVEVRGRIDAIYESMNVKLNDRPTMDIF